MFLRVWTSGVVLIVSWPTGVGIRSMNTRFGATRREDHNNDFFGILEDCTQVKIPFLLCWL